MSDWGKSIIDYNVQKLELSATHWTATVGLVSFWRSDFESLPSSKKWRRKSLDLVFFFFFKPSSFPSEEKGGQKPRSSVIDVYCFIDEKKFCILIPVSNHVTAICKLRICQNHIANKYLVIWVDSFILILFHFLCLPFQNTWNSYTTVPAQFRFWIIKCWYKY